ncbi:class I SAM-dependent methyltransferase [Dyella agri]|uniref:Class I SAM-dependent methyltransferase n=1 Tax=Dyella agri TaxID=1926869 RepID=A0ABW8KKN4_9GAMM
MLRRIRKLMLVLVAALLPVLAVAAPAAASSGDTAAALQKAVDGPGRSAANKARDRYRHPVETLQFFGIRPDMTVIELAPAGGWYTEILAPLLREHGHLIEAPSPSPAFMARMTADPAVFGHFAQVLPFKPPASVSLGAPGSADMVLTFRNTHDWLNHSPETLAAVFRAAFDVLKPGGVFGITEHRAKPFADAAESSKALHRLPEDYLIALGLKAGFRLGGVSEINANPKDPEDVNVHRLPPDLAGPASEHAAMQAIGESDRMTLRFVKP